MTKVQMRLKLQKPLDEASSERFSEARSIYGILGIKVLPGTTDLLIEYDASRLSAKDVESAIARVGVALAKEGI